MFGGIGGWGENDREVPVQTCVQSAQETVCQTEDNFWDQKSAVYPDSLQGAGGREGGSADIKKPKEGEREVRGFSRQLNRLTQPSNRFDL